MNFVFIMFLGCRSELADSQDDTKEAALTMSDCGHTVMIEGVPTAFDECFVGDEVITYSCETCGYYSDVSMSQGSFDCITCLEGYEIDVVFNDCTGYCVPEGTATEPIYTSQCQPVSECVREQ